VDSGEACDDGNQESGDGCSSSCQWETNCQKDNKHLPISCGESRSGSFSGAYGDVENLCGKPFKYQDQIFLFQATKGGKVTVTYTASPDQPDMGLFIMTGSCHSALCTADSSSDGKRHDVSFDAVAGVTYFIDLEAPSQQPDYTLSLQCD
jgi:cysteine-rich repeat protein